MDESRELRARNARLYRVNGHPALWPCSEQGEYPFAASRCREGQVRDENGWWRMPGVPYMPMMLSLKARRLGSRSA